MLINYLKTALRNFIKNAVYSFINIVGLSIGMACCIIIMLFVQDELSWDRYHKNADRIFRITKTFDIQGRDVAYATTRAKLSTNISADLPEVEQAVRIIKHNGFVIRYGEKKIITNPVYADPSLFDVFTFPLISGDKKSVLHDPNSVVLSQELASQFFGEEDPLGKIISVYSLREKYDLHVTGIMKDVPRNSHFWFNFVAPLSHLERRSEGQRSPITSCTTYLLLKEKQSSKSVEEKIPVQASKYLSERYAARMTYFLQPLTDIHLKSDLALELGRNSNISYSYMYSGIALVILLVACINFMNLSTARSSRRAREVGMRKVVGAKKWQLIFQFIGESILLAFLALLVAIFIAYLLLPSFNTLVFRHLTLDFLGNLSFYLGLLLLTLFVGVLSGSYPAIFLSAFKPVHIFRETSQSDSIFSRFIRKGLVVFQFAISLVFIIGTIVVYYQLNYVSQKDLGFAKENVITIPIFKDNNLCQKGDLIVSELSKHPNVEDVLVTTTSAPGRYAGYPIKCVPEGFDEENPVMMNLNRIGEGVFQFFKIDVVEGRMFSKEIQSDASSAVMINETAARELGWDSAVGKTIKSDRYLENSTIVGVVKDYHQGSLHHEIVPTLYLFVPDHPTEILMRINPINTAETIQYIETTWKKLPTHIPLDYYFLEESIRRGSYGKDRQSGKIFTFSAILAIILACLGLFGLSSFTAQQRIREIGIRKVFGASVTKILSLLSINFAKLVLVANLIAWPIAYYIMNKWLQNFAYRIHLNIWIFLFAGWIVLFISLITISAQSLKAATSNPVDSLRYE